MCRDGQCPEPIRPSANRYDYAAIVALVVLLPLIIPLVLLLLVVGAIVVPLTDRGNLFWGVN